MSEIQDKFKVMRRPEVESITGLSRSSIYAKMENGTFPKGISLANALLAGLSMKSKNGSKTGLQQPDREVSNERPSK